MQILDARQTQERLEYGALARAIAELLTNQTTVAPLRSTLDLPDDGTLLLMPAADHEIAMTKMITMHPDNSARGLVTIQGEMIVMDARTGLRRGMLDGAVVSERRTAALSLLAAQHLAPQPSAPLLVVGAGVQARAHLDAFHEGLGTDEVFITSRTRSKADELAAYARKRGLKAAVVDEPAEALDEVGLIATTTTSATAVLPDVLSPRTFVAAVGAFNPRMAEISPALISRATVVVDTLEGARAEAGDLIQAEAAGRFDWERALTLADIVRSPSSLPGPVVFKSVGSSLWDLAAARLAFAG